jgi:hypothetical protein
MLFVSEPAIVIWFQLLGVFSMFPLLIKDGLSIPYFLCSAIYLGSAYLSKESVLEVKREVENVEEVRKSYWLNQIPKYFIVLSSTGK